MKTKISFFSNSENVLEFVLILKGHWSAPRVSNIIYILIQTAVGVVIGGKLSDARTCDYTIRVFKQV